MDAFVDSCFLGSAFAIFRNYVRSRRLSLQFLQDLASSRTGHTVPEVAQLLATAAADIVKLESCVSETLAKSLDHDISVSLDSAKELVLRLAAQSTSPTASEVVVPRVNEESERVS